MPTPDGRPPPPGTSTLATVHFRVLSYNIHKGIGGIDRRYRPERIAETIAHYNPDFALLQEVDEGVPRSHRHRQVDWLGDRLGYAHRAFQSNVFLREGNYGNALLSRYPTDAPDHVDLTVRFKKRRQALVVRAHLPLQNASGREHTRSLILACVHLGLAGFERVMQIRRLMKDAAIRQHRRSTPMIVAGDFNDVFGSLGRRLMVPEGFGSALGNVRTFPAVYPVRVLDQIFFRGDLRPLAGFAGHTKLARAASDHLPIIADFELLDESAPSKE